MTLAVCAADADCDGAVAPADIAVFINGWLASLRGAGALEDGDFDGNGYVEAADVAAYVNEWFRALLEGCG